MEEQTRESEAPLGDVEDGLTQWITRQSDAAEQAAARSEPVARKVRQSRNKSAEPEKSIYKPVAVDALQKLASVAGKYAAARSDPKWIPTDEETRAFAEAADKVVVKYLPHLSIYAEEAALALVVVAYLIPRLDLSVSTEEKNDTERVKDGTSKPAPESGAAWLPE